MNSTQTLYGRTGSWHTTSIGDPCILEEEREGERSEGGREGGRGGGKEGEEEGEIRERGGRGGRKMREEQQLVMYKCTESLVICHVHCSLLTGISSGLRLW